MSKKSLWIAIFAIMFCQASVFASPYIGDEVSTSSNTPSKSLSRCTLPPYLKKGDKVALLSPAYSTPNENVVNTAAVLRGWGLVPVIGPNVGNLYAGKYAGTDAERMSDISWALNDPDIKAIICNRGGYGTIHFVDKFPFSELSAHPKWIVGFSDITTLHSMECCAGVMSIHGTMSSFLGPSGGSDTTSVLLRDLLFGKVPCYELPSHPQNITGHATGTLVGGNLCTFAPLIGSRADATTQEDIILFLEEVEEPMRNLDRLFNSLLIHGVLSRCRGVILGQFTDCGTDLEYESAEAMLCEYIKKYNIPVLCGFPAGHDKVNLPLVIGSNVTLDVRDDGATLKFDIPGKQQKVNTSGILPPPAAESK